jgi:hypothetical protein
LIWRKTGFDVAGWSIAATYRGGPRPQDKKSRVSGDYLNAGFKPGKLA